EEFQIARGVVLTQLGDGGAVGRAGDVLSQALVLARRTDVPAGDRQGDIDERLDAVARPGVDGHFVSVLHTHDELRTRLAPRHDDLIAAIGVGSRFADHFLAAEALLDDDHAQRRRGLAGRRGDASADHTAWTIDAAPAPDPLGL